MSLSPGTPVGRYVIRRKLAEGGMAEIFLASTRGPEGFAKDVVIKRVRPDLAAVPGFVRMFVSEARLASGLNHPNIVQTFDFDLHGDSYYLAMEYVHGRSLTEILSRVEAVGFPPVLAAHVGAEVARGLAHAHRLNLVHRDVSPQNILVSFEGTVKLTDFGIAKVSGFTTSSGALKGKFAYMAPEQARGDSVDSRTDIFALGVVLWEMLTGHHLFEADDDLAILRAVQERVIESPAGLNPAVASDLAGVVMRMLAREPSARFQTADDAEHALFEYVLRHAHAPSHTELRTLVRSLFPEELQPSDSGDIPLQLAARADTPSDNGEVTRTVPSGRRRRRPALVAGGALVVIATMLTALFGWAAWSSLRLTSASASNESPSAALVSPSRTGAALIGETHLPASEPNDWLSMASWLPWPLAVLAVLIGCFLLTQGGARGFRVIAPPLGALIGLLLGQAVADGFGLGSSAGWVGLGLAAVLGGAGVLSPAAMVAIAVGLPMGLAAGAVVGKEAFLLGFVPTALLTGAGAAVLHRPLRVLLATSSGAGLLLLGLLRLFQHVPRVTAFSLSHPRGLVGVAGTLAFVGAVVQLALWGSEPDPRPPSAAESPAPP